MKCDRCGRQAAYVGRWEFTKGPRKGERSTLYQCPPKPHGCGRFSTTKETG